MLISEARKKSQFLITPSGRFYLLVVMSKYVAVVFISIEKKNDALRLTIMRIRFRASDFGLVAKINIIRAKSKQASCAEMVLGSFFFLLV